jgi:uncharacterized membrane-anchored protein
MGSLALLSQDACEASKRLTSGETMQKITGRALPTVTAIQAEAARVEAMIAASTQRIESSPADPRAAMHLQVCRAELHAYLAGLLYSLGETHLLDRQAVGSEPGLADVTYEDVTDDEGPRFVECFEC